ncbi:MAG: ABC transporter substrate-binding protein [Variovorax sp.]
MRIPPHWLRWLTLTLALTVAGCASVSPPKPLSVISFPGGFNWPIWVAQDRNFFADEGLIVKLTPTTDSVFQMSGLIEGRFDIAMTALDNVVAYAEGQGEAPGSAGVFQPVVAFMGGDNGFLRLVTKPDVGDVAALKGRVLAVDALTTGYAFVLREMLARAGVLEGNVTFVRAGGALERFQGLLANKFDATLLISPFELQAQARGYKTLASAIDMLGHYQGLVGATRRDFAQRNPQALSSYVKAYTSGVRWLLDPSHKAEAIEIFRKNLPNANEAAANAAYSVLVNPRNGFERNAHFDVEGARTVLALRSKYGEPRKQLVDVSKYYDPRYYDAAGIGR